MKNVPLLIVKLAAGAQTTRLEVIKGDIAETLRRVKHSSSGSSFPGINLPLPLCDLSDASVLQSSRRIEELVGLLAKKDSSVLGIGKAARALYSLSKPAQFRQRQRDDFEKSISELVGWLREGLRETPDEVTNLKLLLDLVAASSITLQTFTPLLAEEIVSVLASIDRPYCPMLLDLVFGSLEWAGRAEPLGSLRYFQQKAERDQGNDKGPRKQFIYLELANEDARYHRVSDGRLWEAVNRHFLATRPPPFSAKARTTTKTPEDSHEVSKRRQGIDAFTGRHCVLTGSFRGPKLIRMKSSILFSNNTDEAKCFYRYGLGKADTFKVGEDVFLRLSSALGYMAGHDKKNREGKTWMTIPAPQAKKVCLLIAFLEDQPGELDEYAALFGAHDAGIYDADYEARTSRVLAAMKGKVEGNPDMRIRLLAIAAMDEANNQIVLNRSLFAREVLQAAEDWNRGACNRPEVTMVFPAAKEMRAATGEKSQRRSWTTPAPLDICAVVNTVWASKGEGGFDVRYQRDVSASDAYDIFLGPSHFREPKTRAALSILLIRMRSIFVCAGHLKAARDYERLDVNARWQVLKAVALIGVFLHQLGEKHEIFMRESIYQAGRLLALADSLHFQYCKFVRTSEEDRKKKKVNAPSELIGNALFNFALDSPIGALARLAERIRPYKGWADTYTGEDAGLVHWLVRQMSGCERELDPASLPPQMEDIHKAQLLLGYLADHPKSETKDE